MNHPSNTHALYHEWDLADALWMAELTKAFGKDACNRRYDTDKRAHPKECQLARERWKSAGERYWKSINR